MCIKQWAKGAIVFQMYYYFKLPDIPLSVLPNTEEGAIVFQMGEP